MDEEQFVKAVQARFANFTDPFAGRIRDCLSVGVTRLCNEFQWEFLDKLTTFSTTTSTIDASGKTRFVLPDDYFKPVVFYTDNHILEYRNRVEWARHQIDASSSAEPRYYTVIGKELILAAPSDGSTVYAVYTRDGSGYGLDDIPGQFHYAVMMAVVAYLAPAYVTVGEKTLPNPDVRNADRAFKQAVGAAMMIQTRNKGRVRQILPPEHLRMRHDYT